MSNGTRSKWRGLLFAVEATAFMALEALNFLRDHGFIASRLQEGVDGRARLNGSYPLTKRTERSSLRRNSFDLFRGYCFRVASSTRTGQALLRVVRSQASR